MAKWHAHVTHMAKHMNMIGSPLWWGAWASQKSGTGCSLNYMLNPPVLTVC